MSSYESTKERRRLSVLDYHVAWICPLPDVELPSSKLMFDDIHLTPKYDARQDPNQYFCGIVAGHNVVRRPQNKEIPEGRADGHPGVAKGQQILPCGGCCGPEKGTNLDNVEWINGWTDVDFAMLLLSSSSVLVNFAGRE